MLENIDKKKLFLMIAFVVIVIFIGYLLYSLFFVSLTPTDTDQQPDAIDSTQLPIGQQGSQPGLTGGDTTTDITAGEKQEQPGIVTKVQTTKIGVPDTIAQGGITQTTDIDYEKTTNITLSPSSNKIISYNPDIGKFYSINNQGEKVALSDKVYKDVKDVTWSPNQNSAILEFPDKTNIFYNFETDKQITLPKDWEEFNFDSSGNKIAFKDMNQLSEYQFLGIANSDGSGIKYLEGIGERPNDFIVNWSPNNQIVSIFKNGNNGDTDKLYFVGQNDEKFPALIVNGYGLETNWTPDGRRLVYSAYNRFSDYKPVLHIVDAYGENFGSNHQSIDLNTWADKCTFHGKNDMYCAVPKELPYAADLAPEIADNIADYIYKVDLRTGVKTFIAEPEYEYTIDQLVVSEDGSNLFFTDKATQSLHTLRLK
jgi:hypothetical protein